jgi:hypothetical protein
MGKAVPLPPAGEDSTRGEGPTLTEDEWQRVVKAMVDYVNGRTIPLEVVRRDVEQRVMWLERHRRRAERAPPATPTQSSGAR